MGHREGAGEHSGLDVFPPSLLSPPSFSTDATHLLSPARCTCVAPSRDGWRPCPWRPWSPTQACLPWWSTSLQGACLLQPLLEQFTQQCLREHTCAGASRAQRSVAQLSHAHELSQLHANATALCVDWVSHCSTAPYLLLGSMCPWPRDAPVFSIHVPSHLHRK